MGVLISYLIQYWPFPKYTDHVFGTAYKSKNVDRQDGYISTFILLPKAAVLLTFPQICL